MPPHGESTGEQSDRTRRAWPVLGRRPLLKAVGAGAALSMGSGAATGAGGGDEDAEIDSRYGYATPDADEVPSALEPDHEVELHRVFPENPEDPEHASIFHFEPSGLQVDAGAVVQFTFTSPNHTITPYHPDHGFQRRVPEGVPPFSSPLVNEDGAWLYRFEEEGLYDLFCGVHEVVGMTMRVVVGDLAAEDVPDYEDTFEAEPPLFPPVGADLLEHEMNANSDRNEDVEWVWLTAPEVLDAAALDPTTIQAEGEVSFAAVADELGVPFDPDH